MTKLAFGIPGYSVPNPVGNPLFKGPAGSINPSGLTGNVVSSFLNVAIIFAGILLLIWLIMGAFEWITSEGDKEKLAKARARMTAAIIGFIIVILAFTLQSYIQAVLNPQSPKVLEIISP